MSVEVEALGKQAVLAHKLTWEGQGFRFCSTKRRRMLVVVPRWCCIKYFSRLLVGYEEKDAGCSIGRGRGLAVLVCTLFPV